MPECPGKTSHASRSTPQEQRYGQPEGAATIVGQEPSKKSRQRVQIVENGTRQYLVSETAATVVELADMCGLVEGTVHFFHEL